MQELKGTKSVKGHNSFSQTIRARHFFLIQFRHDHRVPSRSGYWTVVLYTTFNQKFLKLRCYYFSPLADLSPRWYWIQGQTNGCGKISRWVLIVYGSTIIVFCLRMTSYLAYCLVKEVKVFPVLQSKALTCFRYLLKGQQATMTFIFSTV